MPTFVLHSVHKMCTWCTFHVWSCLKTQWYLLFRWYATQWHITYCICTNIIYFFIVYFCMNFGTVKSQEQKQQSCWYFYSIFVIIRNRQVKLFSVITQPWRHPGAILCFDVIIDIFISVYHKLTKCNTHKLQVIWQQTDNPCPRARHDAHVRAHQNFNMLKITYKQFWARTRSFRAFQNFPSVRVRGARCARAQREWMAEIQNFHMIWIPDTTIDNFHWFSVTLDLS